MKIVFCNIPMKVQLDKMIYQATGNASCKYDQPVLYPINAVLADELKKNSEVKIVLLKIQDAQGQSAINIEKFMAELDRINEHIGAKIKYEILDSPFEEIKAIHEKRFKDMIAQLERECELFADITFGPKPLPMILMCVLQFAEKFFDADIKKIIYGKVNFVQNHDGKGSHPENPQLYDVTSLYYLSNLTNSVEAHSSEDAIKLFDSFFGL